MSDQQKYKMEVSESTVVWFWFGIFFGWFLVVWFFCLFGFFVVCLLVLFFSVSVMSLLMKTLHFWRFKVEITGCFPSCCYSAFRLSLILAFKIKASVYPAVHMGDKPED